MADCSVNKRLYVKRCPGNLGKTSVKFFRLNPHEASFSTSFLTNRMSSFTDFATKLVWCGCSLNNGIAGIDQGNNYVSGLDDKIVNGAHP